MKTSSSLSSLTTLTALAGLATSSLATQPDLQLLDSDRLVPTRTAGLLYVNLATGERTLTRYGTNEIPEITYSNTSGGIDFWMSIDENPCWDSNRAAGFAVIADSTFDSDDGISEPIALIDWGDIEFDSSISCVILSTATLAIEDIDSNGDGTLDSGIDTVAVYYDALNPTNFSSSAAPTAAIRVESVPGDDFSVPNGVPRYEIVVDFGNTGSSFELGDSDGQNRGDMWLPGAASGYDVSSYIITTSTTTTTGGAVITHTFTTENPTPDGLADFQYLQYYTQHASNDKVTDDSTFIALAAPEGTISYTTPDPSLPHLRNTRFTPGAAPQARGIGESYGIAVLGEGADHTKLKHKPGTAGICCYDFGGLDCDGFLEQLVDDGTPETFNHPSWYNFTPYAQIHHGFFSYYCPPLDDSSFSDLRSELLSMCDPCTNVDFNGDAFIDNGDIGAFIELFLAKDHTADMNGDRILDIGDISTFVTYFLACAG